MQEFFFNVCSIISDEIAVSADFGEFKVFSVNLDHNHMLSQIV